MTADDRAGGVWSAADYAERDAALYEAGLAAGLGAGLGSGGVSIALPPRAIRIGSASSIDGRATEWYTQPALRPRHLSE